jgi:hypothetical protein
MGREIESRQGTGWSLLKKRLYKTGLPSTSTTLERLNVNLKHLTRRLQYCVSNGLFL